MKLREELLNRLGIWEDNHLKEKTKSYEEFAESLTVECLNSASKGYTRVVVCTEFIPDEFENEDCTIILNSTLELILEFLERFCTENKLQMHNFGSYVEVRWR